MNFSKSEFRVLRVILLNPGINIKNISRKTKLSEPRVYSIVQDLRQKDIVKIGEGYNMMLYPSASPLSTQLNRALRSQRKDLIEEAFSGKRLDVLKALYKGSRPIKEISQIVGLSDKRVYHYLLWFESFGIVRNVKGRYILLKDHPLYRSLDLLLSKRVSIPPGVEQDAFVSWVGDGEYLVHTSKSEEYAQNLPNNIFALSTACSAVDDYGIHIIPPDTTLYVAEGDTDTIKRARNLGCIPLEDLILHLLLDAPHREENKRYVRWLITKHEDELDFKLLRKKAKNYNLRKGVESILYDLKPILKRR